MIESTNEKFTVAFENVIIPMINEIMEDDYALVIKSECELCRSEEEFIKFKGAFKQRVKLFYFRKFSQDEKDGVESIFPGSIETVSSDLYFMYVEFKSFLKQQRVKMK